MPHTGFFTILDSVDSTNNYAIAKIRAGMAKHAMAFFAKEQTAGKAQRGKTWQMQPGQNIALSLIVRTDTLRADEQFYLSMLAALAVNDFLKKYVAKDLSIKWPNDLYWRDRKAGGILIETIFKGKKWQWAVIGIGININQISFSKLLPNPVSVKQITGKDYDVIKLAKELYQCLMVRLEELSPQGANEILKEYQTKLYKQNEKVKLKKDNAVFTTTIKGVLITGQLFTKDTMERQFEFGEIEWVL